jgi:periplasmic protein TonB
VVFGSKDFSLFRVVKSELLGECSLGLYGKFKSHPGGLQMPLNVRRFYTSLLVIFTFVFLANAQNPPQTAPTQQVTAPTTIPPAPTSGDIMRERISKAKAFIVVRNYSAAIYELENIRRESNDTALKGVVNVLLMNSYLEQGDYQRAQAFLNEFYRIQKTSAPNASAFYTAVASQIVKTARSRVERYKALGLSVSDRTLPLEATNDLEKMRETLELVITQSKDIGKDKAKTHDAMALLEEASSSRSMLARDDYDARRWSEEVADTRDEMANPGRFVRDATTGTTDTPNGEIVATSTKPAEKPLLTPQQVANNTAITRDREAKLAENKPSDQTVAANDKPVYVPMPQPTVAKNEPKSDNDEQEEPKAPADEPKKPEIKKEEPKPVTEIPKAEPAAPADNSPLDVGSSLVAYATNKPSPVYPSAAKSVRATGVVKVEVTVSETGDVAQVQKTSGPSLLQSAAKDAIKKWKFKPFVRDGQPVKAVGFVNFNFAL